MRLTIIHGRFEQFVTYTSEQMVGKLWKTAFVKEESPHRYMKAVSKRLRLYNKKVRYDTADNFLSDLEDAGFVEIEWGYVEPKKTATQSTQDEQAGV